MNDSKEIFRNIDLKDKGAYKKTIMSAEISKLSVLDLVPFGLPEPEHRFFALRLERPAWKKWEPGQFVMVRPEFFGLELPLARPLSICHVTDRHIVLFFKKIGKGTSRLAQLKPEDKVHLWGPLGNYFAVEKDRPTLLLAGGMGIAPFVGYVYRHPHPWNVSMLFGHKDPLSCYPVDSINERITVDCLREDDKKDLDNFIFTMQEKLRDCADQKGLALACGPAPFLRTAMRLASKTGARLQVSLEGKMACGVGACLGCVTRASANFPVPALRKRPVQVCTMGPVFWAEQLDWNTPDSI